MNKSLSQRSIVIRITFSALLGSLAFIYPYSFFWLVFIFLVPWFVVMQQSYLLWYAAVWAIIFYSFFLNGLFALIVEKGQGNIRFLAIGLLFSYSIGITAVWFFFSTLIQKLFSKRYSLVILIIMLTVYWLLMVNRFYLIFGIEQGNQLQSLIVPLASYPPLLYWLPYVGSNIFLFFIIATNGVIYNLLYNRNSLGLWILAGIIIFFSSGVILHYKKPVIFEPWTELIRCISCKKFFDNPLEQAEEIAYLIDSCKKNYPAVETIIMPESTFPFALNIMQRYGSLWSEVPSLILGSHYQEGQSLYNTLYGFKSGSICSLYTKEQPMFFTEQVPPGWLLAKDLFLQEKVCFDAGSNQESKFELQPGIILTPLICSELFFPIKEFKNKKIYVCVVNDSWFSNQYIPQLMALYAIMVAIATESTIIYCSYHYGFITEQGYYKNLLAK